MTTFDFVVLSLATFRVASLFADEDGPFDVFVNIRNIRGLTELLSCLWCNSVWFGAIWSAMYYVNADFVWLAYPFALSSLAVIIGCLVVFFDAEELDEHTEETHYHIENQNLPDDFVKKLAEMERQHR
jgi:hypothetical protein